jgi:hypothetical protein
MTSESLGQLGGSTIDSDEPKEEEQKNKGWVRQETMQYI